MAQLLKEITNEQFEHMYQTAHNRWYTDKEFFDIMLKNWYVTQDDYNTLYFDEQWNIVQKFENKQWDITQEIDNEQIGIIQKTENSWLTNNIIPYSICWIGIIIIIIAVVFIIKKD